ncbi:MAG: hypothetical protein COV44_01135 [Deltaproteobacteria bacterium CG11_big_fil_rev_8_21_14_0_20_45_16]|nr:MAG: hypothetical protein COV44_01135 [Deltaproteobacteria bacterium CG11_big_fil_rev_8_21_14_0_20_45_16]
MARFWQKRSNFLQAQKALENNDYSKAESLLSSILESDAEAIEALLHRALARLRLKRFDEALTDAEKLTLLRPDNGLGFMIKGEILLEISRFAEAKASLLHAIGLEKDNGRAFFQLGRACAALKELQESADYFEIALQFEPSYSWAQYMATFYATKIT